MDTKVQEYREMIIQCLLRYSKIEEVDARRMVDDSRICEVKNEMDWITLSHELSYYWAMWLLHGKNNVKWYLDSALWPPPDEYYEWAREWLTTRRAFTP